MIVQFSPMNFFLIHKIVILSENFILFLLLRIFVNLHMKQNPNQLFNIIWHFSIDAGIYIKEST